MSIEATIAFEFLGSARIRFEVGGITVLDRRGIIADVFYQQPGVVIFLWENVYSLPVDRMRLTSTRFGTAPFDPYINGYGVGDSSLTEDPFGMALGNLGIAGATVDPPPGTVYSFAIEVYP